MVPYKPKPKDWGSWKIKSPYVTSTIASPPLGIDQNQIQNQDQNNGEMSYFPHSPYYAQLTHQNFMKMHKFSILIKDTIKIYVL